MPNIMMSSEHYEQLLKYARSGAVATAETRESFFELRKAIDLNNGVRRYSLAVRCTPLVNRPRGPNGITPKQVVAVGEFTRKPTREDALALLTEEDYDLSSVQVSADPNAVLGFYELDRYPW